MEIWECILSDMSVTTEYDIIVVGGGLAGLTCAHRIAREKPSLRVLLLEGRSRLGGRLKCAKTKTGKLVDLGGMWVGPTTQPYICNLLQELDIPIYAQYVDGTNIHDDGHRLHQYRGTIPSISLLSLLDTHLMLSKLESLAQTIEIQNPSLCRNSRVYDSISLYEIGRRQCWTQQAQSLLSVATRMVFGFESDQISVLYFLFYCKTAGGIRPLLDSDGGGQDSRMEGGSARLLAALIATIEAASYTILFDCPVISVDYSSSDWADGERGGGGRSTVTVANGSSYIARHVVMCCPPSCLTRITFSPPAPPWKRSLWQRSHAGCWTKVVVVYETAFWRQNGLSGSCVCEHCSLDRPLSGVFDYCDGSGDNPALCCFVCGDVGAEFAALTAAEQQTAVVSHLVLLFGAEASQDHVVDFLLMDWLHDPDGSPPFGSGGCPVDVPALGFFREHSQHLRSTINFPNCMVPAIHFAGTETGQSWAGYMDGAVESGLRVASEVLALNQV